MTWKTRAPRVSANIAKTVQDEDTVKGTPKSHVIKHHYNDRKRFIHSVYCCNVTRPPGAAVSVAARLSVRPSRASEFYRSGKATETSNLVDYRTRVARGEGQI